MANYDDDTDTDHDDVIRSVIRRSPHVEGRDLLDVLRSRGVDGWEMLHVLTAVYDSGTGAPGAVQEAIRLLDLPIRPSEPSEWSVAELEGEEAGEQ